MPFDNFKTEEERLAFLEELARLASQSAAPKPSAPAVGTNPLIPPLPALGEPGPPNSLPRFGDAALDRASKLPPAPVKDDSSWLEKILGGVESILGGPSDSIGSQAFGPGVSRPGSYTPPPRKGIVEFLEDRSNEASITGRAPIGQTPVPDATVLPPETAPAPTPPRPKDTRIGSRDMYEEETGKPFPGVGGLPKTEDLESLLTEAERLLGPSPFAGDQRPLPEGREPFQQAADLQRKKRGAKSHRQLTEGLNKIGQGFTKAAGINADFGDTYDMDARKDEADLEDVIDPKTRVWLAENVGLQIPEGTTWTDYARMYPGAADLRKIMAAEREFGARSEERAQDRELRQEQIKSIQEARDTRLGRVPQKVNEELLNLKNTWGALDALESKFNQINPDQDESFAPIKSLWQRANNLLNKGAMGNAERAAFEAEAGRLFAAYVKSISGAQVSQAEFARLAKNLPQTPYSPETFKKILDDFRAETQRKYHATLDHYLQQGYNVGQYKDEIPEPGASATASSGTVTMVSPDGSEEMEVPADQVEYYKSKGAKVKG